MTWGIPFILEPLAKPIPWHTSCPVLCKAFGPKPNPSAISLDPDRDFYPYLRKKERKDLPKKKFRLLLSGECASKSKIKRETPWSKIEGKQRKKKRKSSIKDWRKAKEKEIMKILGQRSEESKRKDAEKAFGPNNVWIMYKIVMRKKNRNETMTWYAWRSPLLGYQPNLCARVSVAPCQKENRIGKGQNTQSQIPHQTCHYKKRSYWPMIAHVIFDLIGNDLKRHVLTYLWFGIRMKHLPVWDLYTLSDFSSIFSLTQCFL